MAGTWQTLTAGIMEWKPSTSIDSSRRPSPLQLCTPSSLNTKHARQQSTPLVLPSIESFKICSAIEEGPHGTPSQCSSPGTLVASPQNTPCLSETSTPPLDSDSLLEQLQTFAGLAIPDSEPTPTPNTQIFSNTSASTLLDDSEYESNVTRFLQREESPCVRKQRQIRKTKSAARGHLKNNYQRTVSKIKPVVLGMSRKLACRPMSKSKKWITTPGKRRGVSLTTQLASIEKRPRHEWHSGERALLLVIRRFYATTTFRAVTAIFNEIAGLDLSNTVVQAQSTQLELYGSKASRAWAYVFDQIPFDNPELILGPFREKIENAAENQGVQVYRRYVEGNFRPGSAAKAKSPHIRRAYKAKVRAIKLELKKKAQIPSTPVIMEPAASYDKLGGFALNRMDDEEHLSDAECSSSPTKPYRHTIELNSHCDSPSLAFRVWNDRTRTKFTGDGFISEMARTVWNGHFMKPFSPEGQGALALQLLASSHLSMQGKSSAFCSVFTSLVQCLSKAADLSATDFAIIDLRHPLLDQPWKKYHGANMMKWLKSHGQALYRYTAQSEYIIWGSIPREAVLYHGQIESLINLADESMSCANLLNLEDFQPRISTPTIVSSIRAKNITLNTDVARAMAKISRVFGLRGSRVRLSHITEFVGRLVDGWSIRHCDGEDLRTAAWAFSTELNSRVHGVEDTAGAFEDGMMDGTEVLSFFEGRKRKTKKR